jgi:hypothetical protein
MAIKLSYNLNTVMNLIILINNLNVINDIEGEDIEGQDTEEEAIEGGAIEGEDSGEEE